jgi:subtilase family serine protease
MMLQSKFSSRCFLCAAVVLLCGIFPALGAELKALPGQVPKILSSLAPNGRLAATNELWLAIGLPLRDRAGLENFVAQVSDPASPNFRQFLTPEELTARFGPTEQDYAAVENFARANGLAVAATHGNRLLLDVTGSVATVEKAFHITLRTYRHPTEARDFFAPDSEPMVDAALPVVNVSGLNNFSSPHSRRAKRHEQHGASKNGSSPDGNGAIFGNDFRNAYVPGTTLTGAGQSVGLFEWDGSYSNAVAAYAKAAGGGRTNIVVQYVLIDGFNGKPTSYGGEPEVDMDIEMAMAMAPGLSKIVVFEGSPSLNSLMDILNTMAASNSVKSLSCSWGWSATDAPYTNTDAVFLEMAAQGQSFFNASGDSDAFTVGATSAEGVDNPNFYNAPSSSPYITQAGGTILRMNGTGASFAAETNWNDNYSNPNGGYWGSSGGVSSYYTIPSWQTNLSMVANKGSTAQRNIPDVAADSENIYEILGKNATPDDDGGGTSSAAPLWAGFMALVNQQLAANGQPSAGFINPAVYAIGKGANYSACFHDITVGNNEWPSSPSQYPAVTGYDLCTGWGSPNVGLINALAGPLKVSLLIPRAVGTNFQFQFLSQSGYTHAVQCRTNLFSGSWLSYTNVTGDGTVKTTSIPFAVFSPSRQGFVRVLTQ